MSPEASAQKGKGARPKGQGIDGVATVGATAKPPPFPMVKRVSAAKTILTAALVVAILGPASVSGAQAPDPLDEPRLLAHHEGDADRAGGRVFLLTDSVVLGAVEELGEVLSDRTYTAIGYPGFHVWAAPGILDDYPPRIADTVIIALGNNEFESGRGSIDRWIDAVMTELRDTRQVIWVRPRRWTSGMYVWNDALSAAYERHDNLELADWPGTVFGHPEYLYSDGIHLRPAGQWAMARLLDDHIRGRVLLPGRGVRGDLRVKSAPAGLNTSGWALDLRSRDPIAVRLVLDGRTVAELTADRPRPDVDAAWQRGPDHGFVHRIERVRDGNHTVCLDARNDTARRWDRVGCEQVTVAHSPVADLASIERIGDRLKVRGWAFDPDVTDRPVRIRVTADRSSIGGPLATRPRQDVAAKYGIDPDHGFKFTIALPPGTDQACVWALDRPRSRNTRLRCLSP